MQDRQAVDVQGQAHQLFGSLADKDLDTTPHVAQNLARRGGRDRRAHGAPRGLRHEPEQDARPRIEPAFGWLETIKLRGPVEGRLVVRIRERRAQPPPAAGRVGNTQ
jgi:hypothetical protein